MIPSRTKLESFDSFGSHAHRNSKWDGKFLISGFEWNEPILSSLLIFQTKLKQITHPRSKDSEDSSDKKKYVIVSKVVLVFLKIQKRFITLYTGHRFSIWHLIKKKLKIIVST